jgi:hypothetical protein
MNRVREEPAAASALIPARLDLPKMLRRKMIPPGCGIIGRHRDRCVTVT